MGRRPSKRDLKLVRLALPSTELKPCGELRLHSTRRLSLRSVVQKLTPIKEVAPWDGRTANIQPEHAQRADGNDGTGRWGEKEAEGSRIIL
jgi:hypothetical protein